MAHFFTVEDISRIKGVGDVKISPDGIVVAYTVRSMNLEENRYMSDIYTVSTSGGEPQKLTEDGKNGNISWSLDSRWIAYIQSGKDGNTIMIMKPDGSDKRKIVDYSVSNASLGVMTSGDMLVWSPDGYYIAYLASLEPVDKEAKIRVVDRVMYKAFMGYSDMRRRHIFVASVLGIEAPKQLTYGDCDEHSLAWCPDGREIAFTSNRTGADDLNQQLSLYAVDIETKKIRVILETVGACYYPSYSPDGKKLAYIATTRSNTSNESTPEDHHLWIINKDGSNAIDLTVKLDRPSGCPVWESNDEILATISHEGRVPLLKFKTDGTYIVLRGGDRCHGKISAGQRIVAYTVTMATHPEDICVLRGNIEYRLTDLNPQLRDITLVEPVEFKLTGSDGTKLHGFMVKPPDYDKSKQYPGLLNIKGGPSGMHSYSWSVNQQLAAAAEYVQFYVNYRGSSGYGQAFTDAVVGDMLGGEFRDNMDLVEEVVRQCPNIDTERLGVWGGSYGGYLTNWIVTQTPRFKAAVSISSVSNLWTQWACGALPLWTEVELPGKPWEHPDLMIRQSPIWQAHKAKTPTLFLHGELDFDTPICEAEQMFMVLRKNGVPSVMVRYTDDGHGIRSKPINHLDAMRRTFAWFKKYLQQ